jgi:DNA mismatch repair protein MutS
MTTPIRRQYLEIKRRFPQAIVFFRLGDFYETFDEDAKLVARELEITLTSKPMGKDLRVPLAGIPYHSLEAHLKRLVGRGFKVAICEQMEDPKKTRGLVDRDVVRVVTPGTVIEESLLPGSANNYLAAVAASHVQRQSRTRYGLAFVDVTTGEFAAASVAENELASELARLKPAEVLLPDGYDLPAAFEGTHTALSTVYFDLDEAGQVLKRHLKVASVDAFGLRGLNEVTSAAGAVLAYLIENQKAAAANVTDLRVYSPSGFLTLDASARRHLELFANLRDGSRQGTLIETTDATRTSMGARLLARWLGQPLMDITAVERRLEHVQGFYADAVRRGQTRDVLREFPDVERIVGRVVAGSALPRDLVGLRRGMEAFAGLLKMALADEETMRRPLEVSGEVAALLSSAIGDDPAPNVGEGGVIREGFSRELDELRELTGDARKALAALEAEERERTGIRSLRVAYNRVFGYYIEVSKANLSHVPADFQRKQTLVNAERFVTPGLKEHEERILQAREVIEDLETRLYAGVCQQLAARADDLRVIATAIAETDVFSCLAEVAGRYGYTRPVIDEGEAILIREGRHPVVERNLGQGRFVPNDAALDSSDSQIMVLTGPNMAGKSTYLRQVALTVLLAQVGSFVPAAEARIGLVDRIFTRIGAQDDLSRGESTFMVEMLETAAILRNATRRSLVLFDEVGRGTSTYDGLAIARAVVEYLHSRPGHEAKTLFATHYHEMTQLASVLPRVSNFSVAVTEQDGRVVFLHRIVPGGADRSYGIHVAELAGMPAAVTQRAKEVLEGLEAARHDGKPARRRREQQDLQMPLLSQPSSLEAEIASLELDGLTPLQALTKLYELKAKARGAAS